MEDSILIEKVLGTYFILISFLDSTVVWSVGYFIVQSHLPMAGGLGVAMCTGGVFAMYTMGKVVSCRAVSFLAGRMSLKVLLMLHLVLASVGTLFLGVFPYFYGLFVARFLAGVASNIQVLIRKLFFNICAKQRGEWSVLAKKILWVSKIGAGLGIALSGLLSNPTLLLAKASDVSVEKWFLLSLMMFLLYVSGLLLVFSIDTSSLTDYASLKYTEIQESSNKQEKPAQKLSIEEKSEEKRTDHFNFRRFIEAKLESPEEIPQNETNDNIEETKAEEIKYFSPKHIANRSSHFKVPLSARIELTSSKSAETVEEPQISSDFKKTHISFIEDDMPDLPKTEITEVQSDECPKNNTQQPSLHLASIYRIYSTFLISLILESLPYTLIFTYPSITLLQLSSILGLSYILSSLPKLLISNPLSQKFAYTIINSWFIVTLIVFLLIQTVFIFLIPFIYINILTLVILMLACEMILPVGCILISDSVNYSEREIALEQNNLYCLLVKLLATLLTPALIFGINPACVFGLCTIGLIFLLMWNKGLKDRYKYLAKAPYHL